MTLVVIQILNRFAKRKILFLKDGMFFEGRTICRSDVKLRYFRFHISLIDQYFAIPKVQIRYCEKNFFCYLSPNDVKKLENMGYSIEKV
jgi:hypothetical protein